MNTNDITIRLEKEEDYRAVNQVVEILKKQRQIPCTSCRYCTENCPMSINIPGLFSAYNMYLRYDNLASARHSYDMRTRSNGKASDCLKCGACEAACPQHLPIRDLLEEVAGVLE